MQDFGAAFKMGVGLLIQQSHHCPEAAASHAGTMDDRRIAESTLARRGIIQLLHPGLEGPMKQDCELDTMHREILEPIGPF